MMNNQMKHRSARRALTAFSGVATVGWAAMLVLFACGAKSFLPYAVSGGVALLGVAAGLSVAPRECLTLPLRGAVVGFKTATHAVKSLPCIVIALGFNLLGVTFPVVMTLGGFLLGAFVSLVFPGVVALRKTARDAQGISDRAKELCAGPLFDERKGEELSAER